MRRVIFYSLAFCYLLAVIPSPAATEPIPQAAPTPTFRTGGTGFVPPPVDLDHVVLAPPPATLLRDLPARFDWREAGLVTAVRNQGACGSCYAFAAAAELESRVLRDHGITTDLSEDQIMSCHYEASGCDGGNAQMVMNLLTRTGAVDEACDPYSAVNGPCYDGCESRFSVLDWVWLSGSLQPEATALKQALLDHGPLSTTVYAGDGTNPAWQGAFNNWSGGTGLYHAGSEDPNHAVLLVGWDDDHPHSGGGHGCWIIKNSWGAGWGDACGHGSSGGYFYLAYGSAASGEWTSAITEIMPAYPELSVLGHDEGGWTGAFGYNNTTAYGLVRLTPETMTNLHRIEFWTTDATVAIDAAVYVNFVSGNLSGLLAEVTSAGYARPGYHSLELAEPLLLQAGTEYYVRVRLHNSSYGYPLAVDNRSDRAPGNTWISLYGTSWIDLADYGAEAGIRIRTSPHTVLPISDPGDTPPPPAATATFTLEPAWPNPFNPATTLAFQLDEPATVRLRIVDLQGRLVRTLVAGDLPAGRHQARWTGRDEHGRSVAAGVYVGRLDDGLRTRSRRLVLLK